MGGPSSKVEIQCPACGRESWLVKTPVYDGFRKTGDALSCALCKHAFPTEADVPYKQSGKPAVFTDADRPKAIKIFRDDEKGRMCRYCAEYVINPFLQRCGLDNRDVQATDFCDRFRPKPAPEEEPEEEEDPLLALLRKKTTPEDS